MSKESDDPEQPQQSSSYGTVQRERDYQGLQKQQPQPSSNRSLPMVVDFSNEQQQQSLPLTQSVLSHGILSKEGDYSNLKQQALQSSSYESTAKESDYSKQQPQQSGSESLAKVVDYSYQPQQQPQPDHSNLHQQPLQIFGVISSPRAIGYVNPLHQQRLLHQQPSSVLIQHQQQPQHQQLQPSDYASVLKEAEFLHLEEPPGVYFKEGVDNFVHRQQEQSHQPSFMLSSREGNSITQQKQLLEQEHLQSPSFKSLSSERDHSKQAQLPQPAASTRSSSRDFDTSGKAQHPQPAASTRYFLRDLDTSGQAQHPQPAASTRSFSRDRETSEQAQHPQPAASTISFLRDRDTSEQAQLPQPAASTRSFSTDFDTFKQAQHPQPAASARSFLRDRETSEQAQSTNKQFSREELYSSDQQVEQRRHPQQPEPSNLYPNVGRYSNPQQHQVVESQEQAPDQSRLFTRGGDYPHQQPKPQQFPRDISSHSLDQLPHRHVPEREGDGNFSSQPEQQPEQLCRSYPTDSNEQAAPIFPAYAAPNPSTSSQNVAARRQHSGAIYQYFVQRLFECGIDPDTADAIMDLWRTTGHDEESLTYLVETSRPVTRDVLRLILVTELVKASSASFPKTVSADFILDEMVLFFMPIEQQQGNP